MIFSAQGLPTERVIQFPISHIRSQCTIHLILLDLISLILLHHANIIRSSSLRTFFHQSATPSALGLCSDQSTDGRPRNRGLIFSKAKRFSFLHNIKNRYVSFPPQDRIQSSLGGLFVRRKRGLHVKLTTYYHLVPRLRIH